MKILKKLFYEQYKNFKILFRNWSSLFLLIIGPLSLILLIGFAYSGNELHDINIGVVSNKENFYFQNFTFANFEKYEKIEDCINDINLQKLHLCIEYYIKEESIDKKDYTNNEENKYNIKNNNIEDNNNEINNNENIYKENSNYSAEDSIKTEDTSEIPTGIITFYFDNSKKALSSKIVDSLSEYFGNESEKISIESAKTIFANVQGLVIYLKQKSDDIDLLINQSYKIKNDLIERKERLIEVRNEFLPIYNKSKNLQFRLNNISRSFNESYYEINNNIDELIENLEKLKINLINDSILKNLNYTIDFNNSVNEKINYSEFYKILVEKNLSENNFNYTNITETNITNGFYNLTNFNLTEKDFLIISLVISIDKVQDSIIKLKNNIDSYYNLSIEQKKEFDLAIKLMDDLNFMLEKDLELTEEYIIKIDYSVYAIKQIQIDLDKNLIQLSKLEPGLAEKLIKPILQNFEPVKPGLENIKIAFPGLLAIIIIFISSLFANIVSLSEFNSNAFYRNKISPVNILIFVFGLIISIFIVVFIQVFVLLIVAYYSFKINVFSNFISLLFVIFLLSLIFIFIGIIIAILIRNEQASILSTTFLVLAFFLFSDAITPLEIMPKSASLFAEKNPFVLANSLFRKILIFDLNLDLSFLNIANFLDIINNKYNFLFSINEIFYLLGYVIIGFILLILISKKLK